ncbi:related to MRP21-mitochondrial ribosomal protein of the small subunit [Sporisorium reilianum f. sp. reilianum]|uniref:Related to MRP21-mitochondrial ribosomal protein of the small subunit n=1 Tax=Sporisorium reilianum f. sp. reilianum TaxID=72559 RepID=A0A2N8UHX4_9BASI|nr:related to MRP21-mitochondrial ribosomal protein of the small subunit [Sporisorium reilianum f. sp. reilianum]
MSLLRTAVARPLRMAASSAPTLRTALAGPSSSAAPIDVGMLCRTFASTSLCTADSKTTSSNLSGASAASTYTAIIDSLQDTMDKSPRAVSGSRLSRPADGRRGYVEDLEADWAARAVYGEPSWPATPFSGRSIRVTPQADPARAYAQLSTLLRRNNLRQELRLQERYEKPNEERRRKKSERHRRRFADMVRRKVQLVMAIKARGA